MEPIRAQHPASIIEVRRAVRDAGQGWNTALRREIQCGRPQAQYTAQRLWEHRTSSHGWHRCEHDWGCSDTPAKIRDQLRQVTGPQSGRLEPEHIIHSQCEHNDVDRRLGNLGDKSGPSGMRGRSNHSRGTPVYGSAGARAERGGNLTGERVRVIGCANPRDRRLADHQQSQGNTVAGDRPNRRPGSSWKTRRALSHLASLQP
jgi:hypothetical protein